MSSATESRRQFYEALLDATGPTVPSIDDMLVDEEGVDPRLTIEGLGKLNLPLEGDVKLSSSEQAVDHVEPSKIQIRNTGYQKWVDQVVQNLSITASAGSKDKVKHRLRGLVAYNVHSAPSPLGAGIPGEDNTFGLLAVTLSSDFDGGEIKLQHRDITEVIENSGNKEFETSTIAWYMDATAVVNPITRGRRVMLLYSLHWTDPAFPRLPSDEPKLYQAMRSLKEAEQSVCFMPDGAYDEISVSAFKGRDHTLTRNLLEVAKRVWGVDYEIYLARPVLNTEDGGREINLTSFAVVQSELGGMPGNLVWDSDNIRAHGDLGFDRRVCIVIWPLSKHIDFAMRFRARPDKWNTYMGSGKLAGLYEAKPTSDPCRSMWLRSLMFLQWNQTHRVAYEKEGWDKCWALLEKAIVEWRELADKTIPDGFTKALNSLEPDDAMAIYCYDIFDKNRLAVYIDTWDKTCWEQAMHGVTHQASLPMIVGRRYGKSKFDWTRVFMNAINLMPWIEWYRAVEVNFDKTPFTPEISRPLALPLLVQNFRLELNGDMKVDRRTGKMHSYHVTRLGHIQFLLNLIMGAQYNNRDFFLGIVLPQIKCPSDFRSSGNKDNFWRPLGEMLQKDFAASESPVMKEFVKQYAADFERVSKTS